MMGADPSQEPSQGEPDESQAPQGTSICITDNEDGTYTVAVMGDSDADAAAGGDPSADSDSEDGPQTAHSIDEALSMAKQMLTAEAGEESGEPDDGTSGDEPMPADKAKSYWNQMATSRAKAKAQG